MGFTLTVPMSYSVVFCIHATAKRKYRTRIYLRSTEKREDYVQFPVASVTQWVNYTRPMVHTAPRAGRKCKNALAARPCNPAAKGFLPGAYQCFRLKHLIVPARVPKVF